MDKKEMHRISLLLKSKMDAPRECFNPSCTNKAINSHVLQKNGVLNLIADKNGYVMEHSVQTLFQESRFEKKNINNTDVFAFVGFCSKCDKSIFSEIEDSVPSINNYRHLMLFCYRNHLCAMHKTRAFFEMYDTILNDSSFSEKAKSYAMDRIFKYYIRSYSENIQKQAYDEYIYGVSTNEFMNFKILTMPAVDIIASSNYSNPKPVAVDLDKDGLMKFISSMTHDIKVMNIFPLNGESVFVLGYTDAMDDIEDVKIIDIEKHGIDFMEKIISDMMIKNTDTWCVSIALYEKMKSNGMVDALLLQMMLFTYPQNRKLVTNFNIFDVLKT